MALSFITRNKQVIPIESGSASKGISHSSIGAPARLGTSQAIPNDRLFEFAYKAKENAQTKLRERKPIKDVQNFAAEKATSEFKKKNKIEELDEKADALKIRLDQIRGRSADAQQQRDGLRTTLKNFNLEKTALKGYNVNTFEDALRLNNLIGGDRNLQNQLQKIQKANIKKLEQETNKELERIGKAFEDKSKENAEIIDATAREAGLKYDPTTDSYVPDENTVGTLEENLNVKLSAAQKEAVNETQIQAPPKISSPEVMILLQSTAGQERLRKWGYFK